MQYEISQLLPILKDLTRKYTSNESTSVPYETAQQLMSAILYCIREAEQGAASIGEEAGEMVASHSTIALNAIYDSGRKLIIEKTKKAQTIYNQILENFNGYGNVTYRNTVNQSLGHFFKWYDPQFCPQDKIIMLDYPTILPLAENQGVDEVYEYLMNLRMEQQFLAPMQTEYVVKVLSVYHPGYRQEVFNLCSVVLKKIIIHMLAEIPLQKMQLQPEELEKVKKHIEKWEQQELEDKLNELLEVLLSRGYANALQLRQYLTKSIPAIAAEIRKSPAVLREVWNS